MFRTFRRHYKQALKVLFILGTRPEAIKLAPVFAAAQNTENLEPELCITAQHREMLDQVLNFFGQTADYDLDLMTPGQSLSGITAKAIEALEPILEQSNPDVVIVQGDTTTAFVGALAAYYKQIKIAHVEAGLRTHDKYSPFPEEMNRSLVSRLADFHFAPTDKAAQHLASEGIDEKSIFQVGNTVIDALFLALKTLEKNGVSEIAQFFDFLDLDQRIILITGHRRESFGKPFQNIFAAIKTLAEQYPNAQFVYPVHLNPNIRDRVHQVLGGTQNIHLIEPLSYPYLVWLMNQSYLILTDSGGIQEEAPSLGKPVLVMREVTERPEGIDAGVSRLVTSDRALIISSVQELMNNVEAYKAMSGAVNPYGDGNSSAKILDVLTA